MMGTEKELTDLELDRLLSAASSPVIPKDFEQCFMQRLHAAGPASNVVPFPVKRVERRRVFAPWPMAAALAASLVIGFWLGGGDQINNLIDDTTGVGATAMNDTATDFGPAGIDDLTSINADGQS